jgi:hypothetical protein
VSLRSFDIVFNGIRYYVDVLIKNGDTSLHVEYADIDEEIGKDEILKLTEYLINEGFVEYSE